MVGHVLTQKTMNICKEKLTFQKSMDGGEKMGTLDRGYEPRFKRQFKDKRRKKKEFIPKKYRNKYERRFK